MTAGLHINGTGLEGGDLESHQHFARAKSAGPEVKICTNGVGYEQLPDIVSSENDDFLLLSPPKKKTPLAICGMAMRLSGVCQHGS